MATRESVIYLNNRKKTAVKIRSSQYYRSVATRWQETQRNCSKVWNRH